ncbi:MAG: Ig-like domain-containing protein [Ignavibacteriales bacterium]|nr:Ig-like domain-containing protein [Ignavibacteriales bacterium]
MKKLTLFLALVCGTSFTALAQRTDLTGIKICIDPGHGGHNPANDRYLIPDPGTAYWESESNFQKALALKQLLEAKGAAVILTRNTNDYPSDNEPSLATRVALANANNVTWFHSIHSNATGLTSNTSTNYTLMMVREKVVAGGDPVYGPGTGQPETVEAWSMQPIMGPYIRDKMRTKSYTRTLDWTFYGGSNGGYTLGVLRGLQMPGELSEGEFHDYFPVTRRLMNISYCKMEAYAIRDGFLTYFGVPADSLSIVAGELSELGTNKLIDGVKVRLLPENIVYTGDLYHNGYYMLDGLKAGTHTLRFETPGFKVDSVQFTVGIGETKFIDKQFESTAAPVILANTPTNNDTSYAASGQIQIVFSKIMDTASVRSAFSIKPSVRGTLLWTSSNTVLTFKPDSVVLPFSTLFTVRIEGTARSQSGLLIDGNGDGAPGDALQIVFKTRPVDVWAPVVIASSPAAGAVVSPNSVVNVSFDEPLHQGTISPPNVVIREVGGPLLAKTLQYTEANGRGGINIYPQGGLIAGKSYQLRISGVSDLSGNPISTATPLIWSFSVAPIALQSTIIEDFSASIGSWFQPLVSGSTMGADSATFVRDSIVTLSVLPASSRSGKLAFYWNTTTASDWMIREYLSGGPGRGITWSKRGTKLQAYVYGDGSGTLFRFAVDDSVDAFPDGTSQNHEVNQWTPIDWVGWRLVEWDFENDSVGTWLGNGKLEGSLRFDSFQLKYAAGSKIKSGVINVAQIQVVKGTVTAVEPASASLPLAFDLDQNYPNPFNPTTAISYQLIANSLVTLKVYDMLGREVTTVVNEMGVAGKHTAVWDGKNDRGESVSSGVYLYQLRAGGLVMTKKMVLLK